MARVRSRRLWDDFFFLILELVSGFTIGNLAGLARRALSREVYDGTLMTWGPSTSFMFLLLFMSVVHFLAKCAGRLTMILPRKMVDL